MIVKKRHITLIEVLLVVALLSFSTVFIGINITKAVHEQKFQSEVDLVLNQLRLAQDLMLIAGSDAHITFTKGDKHIEMKLLCDEPLPEKWNRLIFESTSLKAIHEVHFEGADNGTLSLSFVSRGSVMSRGVLRLVDSTQQITRYIALEGYPKTLKAVEVAPQLQDNTLKFQEIALITLEEINEIQKTPANPS